MSNGKRLDDQIKKLELIKETIIQNAPTDGMGFRAGIFDKAIAHIDKTVGLAHAWVASIEDSQAPME